MLADRTDVHEFAANMLYNTLKRCCHTPEERRMHLNDQIRMINGQAIINATITLVRAKMHLMDRQFQNKVWEQQAGYPPCCDDDITINKIQREINRLREQYQLDLAPYETLFNELSAMLPHQPLVDRKFDHGAYIVYDILTKNCQTKVERLNTIQSRLDNPAEVQVLRETVDLMRDTIRHIRKVYWDEKKTPSDPKLALLKTIIDEITAVLPDYQPGMFASQQSQNVRHVTVKHRRRV